MSLISIVVSLRRLFLVLLLCIVSLHLPTGFAEIIETGSLNTARQDHTATLLPNGKVLVIGGRYRLNSGDLALSSAELYDPNTDLWSEAEPLSQQRTDHTATLLSNGKVLVVGGTDLNSDRSVLEISVELYDPVTDVWTSVSPLLTDRYNHTATLLPDGKVLVTGGSNRKQGIIDLGTVELYDPNSDTWSTADSLTDKRRNHGAVLLQNGLVLITGGFTGVNGGRRKTSELYNPSTNRWTTASSLTSERAIDVMLLLPDGQVLVTGGSGNYDLTNSTEIYNPNTETWRVTTGSHTVSRVRYSGTLLPNGNVLVTGGVLAEAANSSEIFDPITDSWTRSDTLSQKRIAHTSTLLTDGRILVTGGSDPTVGFSNLASSELYTPPSTPGSWTTEGSLATSRTQHTSTLLPNGKVLVAGGGSYTGTNGNPLDAELYDPTTGRWSISGSLNYKHTLHTATLLANGKVLVVGDLASQGADKAELYDPSTGKWTETGLLNNGRSQHTATLLANGKALITGGSNSSVSDLPMNSAELYDPAIEEWTETNSLTNRRKRHAATLLHNGQVLISGGTDDSGMSAELYDPNTGEWTMTGFLNTPRENHTSTLLPNGNVLIAGGYNRSNSRIDSAELYNPTTGLWTSTGSLSAGNNLHTATLLNNGQVLVSGGFSDVNELYDPTTGTWSNTSALPTIGRYNHAATLLPNGKVLVTGGASFFDKDNYNADLYDTGFDFDSARQTSISSIPLEIQPGNNIDLSDLKYTDSTNAETQAIVQLRRVDNEAVIFLEQTDSSTWTAINTDIDISNNFADGPAWLTVYVDGIPSESVYVLIGKQADTVSEDCYVIEASKSVIIFCL